MSKILFAVSGSIAGFKAAQAVSLLKKNGHDVQIVTTPSALNFVGSATWEGLTDRPVISDVFAEGHQMDHIHLARWADLLILAPASANAIGNWANGLASDLPSTLFLAFEKSIPRLLAPAMNKEMWSHPAIQDNLSRLKTWGVHIVEPTAGSLACGEVGVGRLVEAEDLVNAIESALRSEKALGERILITSGATREPLDGVRFITNVSTGSTGAKLADHFAELGCSVTYLHGQGAQLPSNTKIRNQSFSDFTSLQVELRAALREPFDVVVQAAAVSDFSIEKIIGATNKLGEGKISSAQGLELKLKQNPKLVLNIKEWAQPSSPKVIAFKLTNTQDAKERSQAVDRLLKRPEIDGVVWNDLSQISNSEHHGSIFWKNQKPVAFATKEQMAERLYDGLKH